MAPFDAAKTCAMAAGLLLALTGCGGSGSAAPSKTDDVVPKEDQLNSFVKHVNDIGMVEWSGQLLTKSPDKGASRSSS